jgi:hypothetical protein
MHLHQSSNPGSAISAVLPIYHDAAINRIKRTMMLIQRMGTSASADGLLVCACGACCACSVSPSI